MKDTKPAKTPMGTDGHTDLNKGGKSVDQKAYRSMIGSLFYLCASRPDIMLSVCICARFQSDPRECHLVVVKRILRYLVATPCFGIWYPKGSMKGKCALGPFLSILVIGCQHKCLNVNLCFWMNKVQITSKGMLDRKSTRLNSSHITRSRMPSSA